MKVRIALATVRKCAPPKSTKESSSTETAPAARKIPRHKLKKPATNCRKDVDLPAGISGEFVRTGGADRGLAVGAPAGFGLSADNGIFGSGGTD